MLLANHFAGERITKYLKTKALLRKHDQLTSEKIINLKEYFQ